MRSGSPSRNSTRHVVQARVPATIVQLIDSPHLAQSQDQPLMGLGVWEREDGRRRQRALLSPRGPDHETHGLFGRIAANPQGTNPVKAALRGGQSGHYRESRRRPRGGGVGPRGPTNRGRCGGATELAGFDVGSVGNIQFNGFAGNDVLVVDRRVTATVIADGGAGNDVLIGGGGRTTSCWAASGSDLLFGGPGRDILIGGDGRDQLFARRQRR